MDPEEQAQLLAPTPEQLASIQVFPLIPYLKKDAIVSTSNLPQVIAPECGRARIQ
jgi:hypothetical protein